MTDGQHDEPPAGPSPVAGHGAATGAGIEAGAVPDAGPGRQGLSWRAALGVVAAVGGIAAAVRVAAVAATELVARAWSGSWTGVGAGLLLGAAAQLLSVAILLIGVPVALRRYEGRRRFAAAYVAVILLLIVVVIAREGFAALAFPFFLSPAEAGVFWFVVVPLVWVIPAVAAALIRLRVAGIVVGAGTVAAVLVWGIDSLVTHDQLVALL